VSEKGGPEAPYILHGRKKKSHGGYRGSTIKYRDDRGLLTLKTEESRKKGKDWTPPYGKRGKKKNKTG